MNAKDVILDLFDSYQELTVKEITDRVKYSKQLTHKVVKHLLDSKKIERIGYPPKTLYRLIRDPRPNQRLPNLSRQYAEFLRDIFMVVTDTGDLLEGKAAFAYWCRRRSMPLEKALAEFMSIRQKCSGYYDRYGTVDGLEKLKKTIGSDRVQLDHLHYLDFDEIEQFGKTCLGTLVHYSKQGQNKLLMCRLMDRINIPLGVFLEHINADAIGFIPPAIRREAQLMKYLQTYLDVPLPIVEIRRINGLIPIPQQSLSKLDERIKNADNSFTVAGRRNFEHLVLIDDVVDTGATLNAVAAKIKTKNIANVVTGLAIVGPSNHPTA